MIASKPLGSWSPAHQGQFVRLAMQFNAMATRSRPKETL